MEKIEVAPKEWWTNKWDATDLQKINQIAAKLRTQEPVDKKTAWRAAESEYITSVRPAKWKGKLNARSPHR